ncbi:phosphate acyltransferase PlsX [Cupriavidus sp. WKF15]|uniref:phosphate acyltransferase PlsX n=1 Tax=Cupriavidus sp. WKF15 TaxID=3032282 RepID=UPI0023E14CE7|nr:phosphate acyltransferase PlsX [Cupriavidus sp. WKF15]WER46940.1 phosphate acyltransferase PlsX [Cupriavidus sp. WKF15]
MTIKIAIDCMGGDHGVSVTVPAAISFLSSHDDAEVVLVGLPDAIQAQLKKLHAQDHARVSIVPATEVITMDDPVEVALRKKKDSSMRVAVTQVKEGLAGACISAGNTGALMAVSRYVLKTLEGIERPAIATTIPNEKGWGTTVLDLGANADCEPEHLLQFARMAEAMVAVVDHKEHPTVGLLNIGEEVIKGNEVVKRAGELLRASGLNFHGNVEGNDIFKGTTDIVVCDGFVGNVALKSTEGLAKMIGGMIKEEFTRSWFTKLLAGIAMPVLSRLAKRLDPARYNGASLLGLRGLVIKSHGSADAHSFEWAIKRGYDAAKNGVIERIARAFADKTSAAGAAPASPETTPTPHPSTRAA